MKSSYTINDVLKMEPLSILSWLEHEYGYVLPEGIKTSDDMKLAGELLGKIDNAYSYVHSLSLSAAVFYQNIKKSVPPKPGEKNSDKMTEYKMMKDACDDMALRKRVLEGYADILHNLYHGLSRMITVKIENDKEIKMSEYR